MSMVELFFMGKMVRMIGVLLMVFIVRVVILLFCELILWNLLSCKVIGVRSWVKYMVLFIEKYLGNCVKM